MPDDQMRLHHHVRVSHFGTLLSKNLCIKSAGPMMRSTDNPANEESVNPLGNFLGDLRPEQRALIRRKPDQSSLMESENGTRTQRIVNAEIQPRYPSMSIALGVKIS